MRSLRSGVIVVLGVLALALSTTSLVAAVAGNESPAASEVGVTPTQMRPCSPPRGTPCSFNRVVEISEQGA